MKGKDIIMGIALSALLLTSIFKYENSKLSLEISIDNAIKNAEVKGYAKGYIDGMESMSNSTKLKVIKDKIK